ITPKAIESDAKSAVVLPIARPNLYCPLKAGHCSLHIAFALPASYYPFMSIITHWLKLGGHFELFNGAIKLAGPVINDAQRYMYLRLIRVQYQRVIACRDCRIHPGAVVSDLIFLPVSFAESCIGQRKIGVQPERFFKHLYSEVDVLPDVPPLQECSSPRVRLKRFDICRGWPGHLIPNFACDAELQRFRHVLTNCILNAEDIG